MRGCDGAGVRGAALGDNEVLELEAQFYVEHFLKCGVWSDDGVAT